MDAATFLKLGAPRRMVVQFDGNDIIVRELSVGERAEVMKVARESPALLPPLLVRMCTITDSGSPMFNETDASAISGLRPELIDTVAAAVMRLSGLATKEDDSPKLDS